MRSLYVQYPKLRPKAFPSRRLQRVIAGRKIRTPIGPHDQSSNVVKTIGCIDLIAAGGAAKPDHCVRGEEAVDAFGRRFERGIGQAVLVGVPAMDARLVARLDLHAEAGEPGVERADDSIFRLPGSV